MVETKNIQNLIDQQKDAAYSIKGVASEINIISINAAIESAHAASGIRTMMENVLDEMMTAICRMLTKVLECGAISMQAADFEQFAKWVGVDEIYITDAEGVTVGSNIAGAYGWRFPDDPKTQACAFRVLIGQKDGVVAQPIRTRDIDSQMFKFVGVSRTDQPGIVQIGFRAESITRYQTEIGAVFGILANEIKNLGAKVTEASRKITTVTSEFEKEVKE